MNLHKDSDDNVKSATPGKHCPSLTTQHHNVTYLLLLDSDQQYTIYSTNHGVLL